MKEGINVSTGERPIDIAYRSQLIYAAPSEADHVFKVEWLIVQQGVLASQISVLEEEAKKALIERERWNTRFNAMFHELNALYERYNKLAEEIGESGEGAVKAPKA
ncbi:hypothetical protein PMI08_05255 [Brevibacillus sp. CF112]|uniref:hypothetical protein n=1 Tax=Brevibacillus TaxID=55080 RepID=UPI000271A2BD|nr:MULTISPECIES: hypothetical protein [Brevibacillus]EJL38971.1 hypothetical protein PMI08_05255 [Brevibacillus sp. CF112]MBG9567467.1 hypothetical protein [Brevibacillus agri]